MVQVAFLVEKIITLAEYFKLFFTNMVILLSNFPAFFHDELIITLIFLLTLNLFVLHLITEYFLMKLLSASSYRFTLKLTSGYLLISLLRFEPSSFCFTYWSKNARLNSLIMR